MTRTHLVELVTEPGRHTHPRAELAARMRAALEGIAGAEHLRKSVPMLYARSEIEARHVELPLDVIDERPDWYLAVNEAARALAERTLRRLFSRGIEAQSLDAFVCVSSSHSGFPSLTRCLQEQLGFRMDALCYDLGGLGCAGPTHGIHLAHMLLQQTGVRSVCVLCVDVMATHGEARRFREAPSMEQLVAHCLASDGAAALVLSRDSGGSARLSFGGCHLHSELWRGAINQNFFSASADNQPFLAVGKAIRTRLVAETRAYFETRPAHEPFFMHPGGAALMARLEDAEPALAPSLDLSRAVLRENGNLGAPSVLWVWARALEAGLSMSPALTLFALGPGIVTTALRLAEVEERMQEVAA